MPTAARTNLKLKGPADRKNTVTARAAKNRKRAPRVKQWFPIPKMFYPPNGEPREQSMEDAWNDARALVRHYVAMGYTREIIGELMQPPITPGQLSRLFSHEMKYGLLINNARIGAMAFQMAASGQDGGMTRYWLRSKAGWRDFEQPGGRQAIKVQMIEGDDTI